MLRKISDFFNSTFKKVDDVNNDDSIYVHGNEDVYNQRFKKIKISNVLQKAYNFVLGKIEEDEVIENAIDAVLEEELETLVDGALTELTPSLKTDIQSEILNNSDFLAAINDIVNANIPSSSGGGNKKHYLELPISPEDLSEIITGGQNFDQFKFGVYRDENNNRFFDFTDISFQDVFGVKQISAYISLNDNMYTWIAVTENGKKGFYLKKRENYMSSVGYIAYLHDIFYTNKEGLNDVFYICKDYDSNIVTVRNNHGYKTVITYQDEVYMHACSYWSKVDDIVFVSKDISTNVCRLKQGINHNLSDLNYLPNDTFEDILSEQFCIGETFDESQDLMVLIIYHLNAGNATVVSLLKVTSNSNVEVVFLNKQVSSFMYHDIKFKNNAGSFYATSSEGLFEFKYNNNTGQLTSKKLIEGQRVYGVYEGRKFEDKRSVFVVKSILFADVPDQNQNVNRIDKICIYEYLDDKIIWFEEIDGFHMFLGLQYYEIMDGDDYNLHKLNIALQNLDKNIYIKTIDL